MNLKSCKNNHHGNSHNFILGYNEYMNTKETAQAGIFYPDSREDLENLFKKFDNGLPANYNSRLIIVPHAGYIYSGQTAYNTYKFLDKSVKNVFVFSPSHYERLYGCVISSYDSFKTSLGALNVNSELTKEFAQFCGCDINDAAFEKEHSIEVQLPFIKYFLPDVQIIPVVYGCENFKNLTEVIDHFYQNKENAFIISSDLSHYYPAKEAIKLDNYTAGMIESNDVKNFEYEQACGAVGICGAVNFAAQKDYSFIRTGLTNSSAATGDTSRVVGYGGWFLYEGEKNEYIKENYSELLIKTARESIQSGLQLGSYPPAKVPCVLEENGASFVTLEINNNLRGCIGSIMAHRPLINDLYKNAHASAFSDPRFRPLTVEEFPHIKISISLLSAPKRVEFKTEEELLDKLIPNVDGLIIRDKNYQAVFLPVVWEQLPDKKEFLNALKQKAGMPHNYFSETLEAFTFRTIYIQE